MSDETDWRAQGYALPPNEFSPEPEKPVPTGLQKLPRTWAYLTRGARPADSHSGGLDAFGNPITETVQAKAEPGKTQNRESAFSGDWPTGDGDAPAFDGDASAYDRSAYFDTLPPDLAISHHDQPILESFARHMHGHSMTPTQVHETLRWGNELAATEFEGDAEALYHNYVTHMQQHGLTAAQANHVKQWMGTYLDSETFKDDMAEAAVDEAIERIQSKMGTAEYIKSEKMQEAYRILLDVRDGDGEA